MAEAGTKQMNKSQELELNSHHAYEGNKWSEGVYWKRPSSAKVVWEKLWGGEA